MNQQKKVFCELCAFGLCGPMAAVMAGYDLPEAADTAAALLAFDEVQTQIGREKERQTAEYAAIYEEIQRTIEGLLTACGNVTPQKPQTAGKEKKP